MTDLVGFSGLNLEVFYVLGFVDHANYVINVSNVFFLWVLSDSMTPFLCAIASSNCRAKS